MLAASECRTRLIERWILVILGGLLLCLGVSGVSLWIDEGYSAQLALQPSFAAWIAKLYSYDASLQQAPAYYLYLWLWARLFGAGEWALRMANLPWAMLYTASLAWGAERLLNIRRAWLILCLSPFIWFYMNEARPYAMLLGVSMVTTVALLAYARDAQRFRLATWWVMVSLLVLWSAHMLTISLVPSLLVVLYFLRPASVKVFLRQWIPSIVVTLPFYILLSMYYLHTLGRGEGLAVERPGAANLVFAFYEFLGFGGLGPPRNILRLAPSFHTLLPYLSTMCLGVLALGAVVLAILQHVRNSVERKTFLGLSTAFATGILVIFALSYAAHFRLLGRHLAAFFPLLALLLLAGLPVSGELSRRKFGICTLLLLGVAWSVSDYRQRVLPAYQKDDYRDASKLAKNTLEHGEAVLWIAGRVTADYYGLPNNNDLETGTPTLRSSGEAASGVCSLTAFRQQIQQHRVVLVVMSDREVLDPGNRCRNAMQAMNPVHVASFNDFDAWQVRAQ